MVKVFYAGDSTVTFNKINSYPQSGLSQGLTRYLNDRVILRPFGFNGRSTKSFIEQGHLAEIAGEIEKGDFLLIEFGHNDPKKEDPLRYADPQTYGCNLKKMIRTASEKNAFPVLITPVARRYFTREGVFEPGSHSVYPEVVKNVAREEKVPVIDLTERSEAFVAGIGDLYSRPLYMWPKDNTHLKPEGAVVFAGFIAEALRALGSPYSDILIGTAPAPEDLICDKKC
jgi:lysophospholipase L1-like esterase